MPVALSARFKVFTWAVVRIVQAIAITLLLSAVYLGVVGPMYLLARVFRPALVKEPRPLAAAATYWEDADENEPDEESCLRQS